MHCTVRGIPNAHSAIDPEGYLLLLKYSSIALLYYQLKFRLEFGVKIVLGEVKLVSRFDMVTDGLATKDLRGSEQIQRCIWRFHH